LIVGLTRPTAGGVGLFWITIVHSFAAQIAPTNE